MKKRIIVLLVAVTLLFCLGYQAHAQTDTVVTVTPMPLLRQLELGHHGEDVLVLQERLTELGYDIGKPDGQYGNKTSDAVKLIQERAGLTVTGIVDDETHLLIWSEDAPLAEMPPLAEKELKDYILNKNTKKFHYTWCGSVDQMKEKNKVYYTGTSEGAIADGYVPCKNCNP